MTGAAAALGAVLALAQGPALAIDLAVWAVLGLAVGYGAHRLPDAWLERDRGLTRLRPWEAGGRRYERVLRVHRWKWFLPDAGPVFAGGRAKRTLATRRAGDLERLAVETRRAELTHWVLLAAGPWFLLWNPRLLGTVMVAYAVIANLPCLLVQRYNRARIERFLARRAARRP